MHCEKFNFNKVALAVSMAVKARQDEEWKRQQGIKIQQQLGIKNDEKENNSNM